MAAVPAIVIVMQPPIELEWVDESELEWIDATDLEWEET